MWMMMPDEVDVEYAVVICGMCMVTEVNVLKRENELLKNDVGELRLRSITKEKEVMEVKRKEEDPWNR